MNELITKPKIQPHILRLKTIKKICTNYQYVKRCAKYLIPQELERTLLTIIEKEKKKKIQHTILDIVMGIEQIQPPEQYPVP